MKIFPFKTFVFDCETTDFDPAGNQLLSLGGVLLNEELEEMGRIELFFKHPKYNVHPDALRVNQIDIVSHHERAIPPYDALSQLERFLPGNVAAAGWNVGFDLDWLWALKAEYKPVFDPFFRRLGDVHPRAVYAIDIYALAVAVTGDISAKPPSVHTALADAEIEAAEFRRLMKHIQRQEP